MAGEIVYADLNIRGDSSLASRPQPPHCLKGHHVPRWHQMALRVSWAANVILLGALMALTIWVFQGPCSKAETGAAPVVPESEGVTGRNRHGTDCNSSLVSHLRQHLCGSLQSSSAGPPACGLCPPDWLLHGDKCYWLSKESRNWNKSCDDCSAKNSRMLVIQDQHEMVLDPDKLPAYTLQAFINNITEGKYPVWIGLHLTTAKGNWTWVDGSLLNQTGVSLSAPDTGNSCGVWKENQIRSEMCSGNVKWICQREAVLI